MGFILLTRVIGLPEGIATNSVDGTLIYSFTMCIQKMSVVSVRVDKRVKERLERSGIEVSKEVKKHLEDLAWQLELEERLKRWEKYLEDMPPSKQGFAARSVREDRESH